MWVRFQGFNFLYHHVPGEKETSENNNVDYYSRHPQPLAVQESHASKKQANFELRETVEEFQKDMMTNMKSSVPVPEVVTWQELLEEPNPGSHR